MSNFNFSGVEEVSDKPAFVAVQPGYQKLTINSVEDVTSSKKGSLGVKVTFSSDKGGTFNQDWWLASSDNQPLKAAMPSFKYLVEKFTGNPLDGNVSTEALSVKLVGRSLDVTVGERRYTTEKDGKVYNNVAAWLPFAGYAGETEIRVDGAWDAMAAGSATSTDTTSGDLPF